MFATWKHLLPRVTEANISSILLALFRDGAFKDDSQIRRFFAGYHDKQVLILLEIFAQGRSLAQMLDILAEIPEINLLKPNTASNAASQMNADDIADMVDELNLSTTVHESKKPEILPVQNAFIRPTATKPSEPANPPKLRYTQHCKYFSTGRKCAPRETCFFIHDQAVRDLALEGKQAYRRAERIVKGDLCLITGDAKKRARNEMQDGESAGDETPHADERELRRIRLI
jgi:hypothetical protein